MASTFKFHSNVNEVVPWQATYSFPTQATKINKQVVKLPPKNGSTFTSNQVIRIEFPADNYLNVLNSVLAFDLKLLSDAGTAGSARLQRSGAHSLIKRLRILYGSLVIEDIQEYKTLVRIFTELGVQNDYAATSGSILDGLAADDAQAKNQLYDENDALRPQRTFCLNLMSGLLTCKKLVPLKWMASQLAIEITLASVEDAFTYTGTAPTYSVDNVNFIAEMLDFDSTYDAAFFMGLSQGGVPLKFSSWHFHSFALTAQQSILQIHERSRSVKSAFAVIRDSTISGATDSDRFYHNAGATFTTLTSVTNALNGIVSEFQWRVGGRYYPAQPVRCVGGGAEAYTELLKTVDALGSYIQAARIDLDSYTIAPGSATSTQGGRFIMGCEFENTDVMPNNIAGINAEEQSDIALSISLGTLAAAGGSSAPVSKKVDVFMHYDCMLVIREGNVVDLVM